MSINEDMVRAAIRQQPPKDWQITGRDRTGYLDLAETIVREAADWLDDEGDIIDPVEKDKWGQTTTRFVSSASVLIAEGRCLDLKPLVIQSMGLCCRNLASGNASSPDFWLRELMTAYDALVEIEPGQAREWATILSSIEPEKIYWHVESDDVCIEELHNWTVYAAAGEAMRARTGLSPDQEFIWGYDFFDKYMPAQLNHFSERGMYRDPGDPMTYDLTTRIQFQLALNAGAGGGIRDNLDALLRDGGLATLLMVSAEGFVPFGGRSSQYHFQEVMVSLICELEANRWLADDPDLAGAFKRQARLSLACIEAWFEMKPFRNIKNSFMPHKRHGFDDYGKYAVYSLLTASLCVLAAQYADDSIQEHPTVAEIGGFVYELSPAFHKLIANCGGSQVVIDTCGDPHYDATGLGRFCHIGKPLALCLGMPIAPDPTFHMADESGCQEAMTIGPEYFQHGDWVRLADSQDDNYELKIITATRELVDFEVNWHDQISERYQLSSGKLLYRIHCNHHFRLIVPLLVNTGNTETSISVKQNLVQVKLSEDIVTYHFAPGAQCKLSDKRMANRNAVYQKLTVTGSARIEIILNSLI